jgi:hypothetical protein
MPEFGDLVEPTGLPIGSDPEPVNRPARLLAFFLTQDVVAGTRLLDTPVYIPDGSRPFDETSVVLRRACDRLDPAAVEIALLLRREGYLGTVEALLAAAASLSR